MGVFGLNLPLKKPLSNRPNQGSMRIVLLPKVISQPSVPNHLRFTPLFPGPPLLGGVSAPSAAPGTSRFAPAAAATPAVSPAPRNCLREKKDASGSMKHIVASCVMRSEE